MILKSTNFFVFRIAFKYILARSVSITFTTSLTKFVSNSKNKYSNTLNLKRFKGLLILHLISNKFWDSEKLMTLHSQFEKGNTKISWNQQTWKITLKIVFTQFIQVRPKNSCFSIFSGYERTLDPTDAHIWLVVTCSIREGAESKVWNKLKDIRRKSDRGTYKESLKVGLLGCMAERLKDKMLETNLVDLVAGPDSYRWGLSKSQILRETNFGESRSPKTAIFGDLNFVNWSFSAFRKC